MSDYIYYTRGGRIAKREYHSIKEIEQMIAELPEGEGDASLDAQLAAAQKRASAGTRIQYAGVKEAKRFLFGITERLARLADNIQGLDEGTVQKEIELAEKQRELKQFWLAEQASLAEQFKAQEAGDRAAEKEESNLKRLAKNAAIDAARQAVASGIKHARKRRKA